MRRREIGNHGSWLGSIVERNDRGIHVPEVNLTVHVTISAAC
jgi:hypothetical protein